MTDETPSEPDDLDDETKRVVSEVDETLDRIETESPDDETGESEETDDTPEDEPNVLEAHAGEGRTSRIHSAWARVLGFSATILLLLVSPVMVVANRIPGRVRVYRKCIDLGFKGLQKKTGAHLIAMTIYGDREIVPRLAEVDEEEQLIRTKNGEQWSLPDGLQSYTLGEANVVWGVADAHELVTPVGARTAEKLDLKDAVYVQNFNQRVKANQQKGHEPAATAAGGQQVRADGGHYSATGLYARSLNQWNGEPFEDVYINWANTNPDAEGMIVSLEKHYELQHSQAGNEEMKKQEDRGRLAEAFGDDARSKIVYLLLGVALTLGIMLAPELISSIGGSDGGGSSIPIAVQPFLLGW